MITEDKIKKIWPKLTPIEKLFVIYLQEGHSIEEAKEIIEAQIELVACELFNTMIDKTKKRISSDRIINDLLKKLEL